MSEWFSSLPPRAREDVSAAAYRLQILWDHWTSIANHVETIVKEWKSQEASPLLRDNRDLKLSKFPAAPTTEVRATLHWPALERDENDELPDWVEPLPNPQPAVGSVWLDPEILSSFHLPQEVIALIRWPGLQEKLIRLLRKNRLEGLQRVLPMGWLAWEEVLPPFARPVHWENGDWEDALDRGEVILPQNAPRVDNRPPLLLIPPPNPGLTVDLTWIKRNGIWEMQEI